jgi:hypothetical protein
MLVYREQRQHERPALLLADVRHQLAALGPACGDAHDRAIRLLIDLGVLEAGVMDAVCPEEDALSPQAHLRRASIDAGHLVWHSWQGDVENRQRWVARLATTLGCLHAAQLPDLVEIRVPEGYAHYGLMPEAYLLAATHVARTLCPAHAVCIGIRSIGTSLSALVTATLEEHGCRVLSLTVRPHGHPFDRRPRFAAELACELDARSKEFFLIVDEGPGLSGSSLAGTAVALEALGVGSERIVLLPSWRTDGSHLRSADARARWGRYRQFSVGFEETWIAAGRRPTLGRCVRDLSAGHWRDLLYRCGDDLPAVHPQHERRKLLASAPDDDGPAHLLRFAGLGRYGDGKLERARELAEAGFCSTAVDLEAGYLTLEFVPGVPVRPRRHDLELLDAMARYLAHLRRRYASSRARTDDLEDVLRVNVREGLGDVGAIALERRLSRLPTAERETPTMLDGRMLPHEWVSTASGYRKTDAVDHHDDHFYPGPQDIAWDVAGTCLEFGLTGDARRELIARYRRASGDREIPVRLPFHALAYLACRLGYATFAADALGNTPDGVRFRRRATTYRRLLRAELAADGGAWHA